MKEGRILMAAEERLKQKYGEVLANRNEVAVEKVSQILDLLCYEYINRDWEPQKINQLVIVIEENIFKVYVYSWNKYENKWGYYCRLGSFSEELQSALDVANEEIGYDDGMRIKRLLEKYCDVRPISERSSNHYIVNLKE